MAAGRPESAGLPLAAGGAPRSGRRPVRGGRPAAVGQRLRPAPGLVGRPMARWPVRSGQGSEQGSGQGPGMDRLAIRCVQAGPWARLGPAERPDWIGCRQAAVSAQESGMPSAKAQVAVRLGHQAHASAAVPVPLAAIQEHPFPAAQVATEAGLVPPAASARSARQAAAVVRHGAVLAREAAAPAARNAAALAPRAAEEVQGAEVQRAAVPRPEVAALGAAGELRPEAAVAVAVPDAAAERPPAAEAPGAAEPQPEAVVAERDAAVRPRAAEPGAAGLPRPAAPLALPSALVCRLGRLRPRAAPPAPQPGVRFARGRPSLRSAAPKWQWWQAAQDEV